MALTKATLIDLNSNELILDLDADTSITADTDDTIHFKIAGADELVMTGTALTPAVADGSALGSTALEWSDIFLADGAVINFGADQDINITHVADTGLTTNADFTVGDDLFVSGGLIDLKNTGTVSTIKFYCESSNAHAQSVVSAPHSEAASNTLTLPGTGGNARLVSTSSTATLTNKTLTTPVIAEIDSGSTITLDATTDIVLDADGGDIIFKDGGTTIATFTNSSTDLIIESATSDKDIIFKVNDGGSSTEVMRLDGDVSALLMASGKELRFADSGEKISSDGTDLTIASGAKINLTATSDVVIPANVGITFGTGEKIEGDSTDLTITSGAKINLTATSDVHIPNDVGIVFGGDSEKIEGDGTDLVISANNLTIDAAADIILDAAGNDFQFKAGGTHVLSVVNSSSDVIIKPIVDAKDIIFQQRDGTEVARIEDNATFNVVTDKLAINGTAVTSTAAELNKLDGVGTLAQAGKQTIWVPSNAMTPTATNGCADLATVETTSGRPDMSVLDFDKDSDEFAQFAVAFPKSWDAGTVTCQFFWSGIAATTGVALNLQGVAFADNDSIDTAYGTAVVVQDDAQGAVEELLVSAESGAITIAGSPGANELTYFRVGRDVSDGNDDMAGDCRLHGIKLHFTTNAANDA